MMKMKRSTNCKIKNKQYFNTVRRELAIQKKSIPASGHGP